MPAPGDQHRDTAASINPFISPKPHVTQFTAKEIATLQVKLDQQLGPEFISTRPGNGGGKVHYLAGEKAINLANQVFGFNGWSSAIQNVQIDFVDENPQNGKVNLGLSTIVRVTLKDGTYHEDIGYGHCENARGKAAAFEKAKKEAATDALKRALRNFGNVLGNCLYDKDYLQRATKCKIPPSKWDADRLYRHPDYVQVKKEVNDENSARPEAGPAIRRNPSALSSGSFASVEFEDDFGGNFLDETDFSHPDGVSLDDSRQSVTGQTAQVPANDQRQGVPRTNSMPQLASTKAIPPVQPVPNAQQPQKLATSNPQAPRMLPPQTPGGHQRTHAPSHAENPAAGNSATAAGGNPNGANLQNRTGAPRGDQLDETANTLPRQPPPGIPEGFVTGRKADLLSQPPESRPSNASLAFNPHLESPSIRRTHGVNPGKSAPVSRQSLTGVLDSSSQHPPQQAALPQQGGAAAQNAGGNGHTGSPRPPTANFVNPSADPNRRIGMPQVANQAVAQNRGPYRPPTTLKRPALADVSNIQHVDTPSDAKKIKAEPAAVGANGPPAKGEDAAVT